MSSATRVSTWLCGLPVRQSATGSDEVAAQCAQHELAPSSRGARVRLSSSMKPPVSLGDASGGTGDRVAETVGWAAHLTWTRHLRPVGQCARVLEPESGR